MKTLLLSILALTSYASETYQGFTGYWLKVNATAYSPHDPIDGHYRATKGEWLHKTANGTDVRTTPYGVAVPSKKGIPTIAYGTKIIIPELSNKILKIDDTGAAIRRITKQTGVLTIDVRFKTTKDALKWVGDVGRRQIEIFIVTGKAPRQKEMLKVDELPLFYPIELIK
jgi:3D (Asp-Asp-Asp) domain-containing protein